VSAAKQDRLRNLGPASRRRLSAVGIETLADLRALGVVDAYKLLEAHGYNVSLNLAWALAGAILDCDWRKLPDEVKRDLRARIKGPT
jgi:DNA transformation protein